MTKTPDKPGRSCTMCGTSSAECMTVLGKTRRACCGLCGDGNTHLGADERDQTCAEWAKVHGGPTVPVE